MRWLLLPLLFLAFAGCARKQPAADAIAGAQAILQEIGSSTASHETKHRVHLMTKGVIWNVAAAVSTKLEDLPPPAMDPAAIQADPIKYMEDAKATYEESTSPWWGLAMPVLLILGGVAAAYLSFQFPWLGPILSRVLAHFSVQKEHATAVNAARDAIALGEDLKPLIRPEEAKPALDKARLLQEFNETRNFINTIRSSRSTS